MLLPLLYFEATEAVLLYLVSGVALKVETSRWLSSGKLVAPKEDNIQFMQEIAFNVLGNPINGRHWVIASISISRVLPTLKFAPA